ncbi:hypothetical protein J2Z31_001160 [Sinorhizobium kostiense]|uniref:Uncharacterized protein n=1 Tax=Sinorhizobium kostiense TaxID=76747 RepID=A0ABS4QVK6_9HYPH|nr:hypothetical protein [Sinorhizobium kostiense]MBP2234670.1 hypothetical protein [Sinorhizobium kostiense]
MPRQGKTHEPNLTRTTGSETSHERRKARPETGDLTDPKEVWKDSETTPQPKPQRRSDIAGKRVADAGDLKAGEPSPYDIEVQADRVAEQTKRDRPTTKRKR